MIKEAIYYNSYVHHSALPKNDFKHIAFIGRSNVGKSSLISHLCNNKNLAKVSKTPGKTKTINLFLINKQFYIADLPGYGYAKRDKKMRGEFSTMIDDYLQHCHNLSYIFILIDSSIPMQQIDVLFIEKMKQYKKPFGLMFTKTDKASQSIVQKHINEYVKLLANYKEDIICFTHSIKNNKDIQSIVEFIFTL